MSETVVTFQAFRRRREGRRVGWLGPLAIVVYRYASRSEDELLKIDLRNSSASRLSDADLVRVRLTTGQAQHVLRVARDDALGRLRRLTAIGCVRERRAAERRKLLPKLAAVVEHGPLCYYANGWLHRAPRAGALPKKNDLPARDAGRPNMKDSTAGV